MDAASVIAALRDELREELVGRILPFWADYAVDGKNGGFIGHINGNGEIDAEASRSVVLNTRILWTFSAAYRSFGTNLYRQIADRAAAYLVDRFKDREYGGVFWTVDRQGKPLDDRKHVYAQAFAVYSLAEHFRATGSEQSVQEAIRLYRLIEQNAADHERDGYDEAFSRDWTLHDDLRLSEEDDFEPRSMNTHLHIIEAYTNLFRVHPEAYLGERIVHLINLFLGRMVNRSNHHLWTFFDEQWAPKSDLISFGHDIEASWLLLEAADVMGDDQLRRRVRSDSMAIAAAVLNAGFDHEHGGLYEEVHPPDDLITDKEWWPQAEAIVGFFNAYQETGDVRFLEAAHRTWAFVKENVRDMRGGEWFRRVSRSGKPYTAWEKIGPWKCPYHNGRACLEIVSRASALLDEEAGTPAASPPAATETPPSG